MDVEFVKLVYVGHPLEADKSRRGVEIFFYFYGGWEERCRDETPRGEEDVRIFTETASFFLWSFFF